MDPQTQTPVPHDGQTKTFAYIFGAVILLFIVIGFFLFVLKSKPGYGPGSTTNEIPTPTVYPIKGLITLVNKNSSKQISKSTNLTLLVRVNSDGNNITGFDGLLTYDLPAFTLVSVNSLTKDFRVIKNLTADHLTMTGVKTPGSSTNSVLTDTNIVELVFKPLKVGNFSFTLRPEMGREKSKLVTDKNEVIRPKLDSLEVTVY